MSSLYNLEPQPTAKVILHTTSGPLLLSLFASQTPLASRNFLQHCLDGYYTGSIFHRLVPGFIIQGGDPTGTGSGGESAHAAPFHGRPFEDEFHSRLKFNRRGLLGMANTGKDDNGSQFFLTLAVTKELEGKHTLFGRVEGDTIFNLVKMGEADLVEGEGSERPMYPTRITGAEVLVNPFEDMVAQVRRLDVSGFKEKGGEVKKKGGKRKPAKGLLSFGDEEPADDAAPTIVKPKFNSKLVEGDEDEVSTKPVKRAAQDAAPERPRKRRASPTPSPSPPPVSRAAPSTTAKHTSRPPSPQTSPEPETKPSPETEDKPTGPTPLERTQAQIAELKRSLQRNVAPAPTESTTKKSALEAMIPSTATRGRRRRPAAGTSTGTSGLGGAVSRDEQRALDSFNAFRKRLDAVPAAPVGIARVEGDGNDGGATNGGGNVPGEGEHMNGATPPPPLLPHASKDNDKDNDADASADADEATLCDLHFVPNCQSCRRWDQDDAAEMEMQRERDEDDEADPGWLAHRLTFEKDRLGKDLEWKRQNERELVVIDPREREREIVGRRRGKERGMGRV